MHANYLRSSIEAVGLDPDRLATSDPSAMSFASGEGAASPYKAWRDIWGCGQGIGAIGAIVPAAHLVARLDAEYRAARSSLFARVPEEATRMTP